MQIIEIPRYNEDGSIDAVLHISPEEAQQLLTFAVNFLAGAGWAMQMDEADEDSPELND